MEMSNGDSKEISEKQKNEHKWYSVNVFMLSPKLSYLLIYAKEGCFKPYMVLFLVSTGLTPAEAGLINGLCFIGYLIGAPFWGYLADRYHKHRLIVSILLSCSVLFMSLQAFISVATGDRNLNHCPQPFNESYIEIYRSSQLTFNKQYTTKHFWLMLCVNTIAFFFDGATLGFLDAGTVQKVFLSPRRTTFGHQRLYGSIGFGLGTIFGSFLIDMFPNVSVNCYTAVFLGYTVLNISLFFTAQWLFYGLSFETTSNEKLNTKRTYLLKSTLWNGHVIFFLLTVLVCGILQGLYIYYTLVYLKELGAPTILNGICLAVGAFPCVLSFALSHRIISFLGGRWKTMGICCGSYLFRFLTVAFIKNPWLVLIVQPLQAIGLGIFIATAVEHVKQISKLEIQTTMYGIMNACFYAVSMVVANIIGGQIYYKFGGRILFCGAAIFASIWSMCIGLYVIVFEKKSREEKREEFELENLQM